MFYKYLDSLSIMKTLSIGDLKLKNPLILAPMMDVTDSAYRLLCRKAGASLAYTEMIQSEALMRAKDALRKKTFFAKGDSPLGIQITGRNPKDFEKIIPFIRKYDLVDLNCGCPGHLTMVHGSGSYLLKNPEKIAKMIRILKKNNLITTAKIRLGYSKNISVKLSKKIERAGADAITVHARLATQGRGAPADWSWFTKIKKQIGIPLIGNGDILSEEKAKEALSLCDGIMIARAAIGDPLFFKRTLYYLKTGKKKKFDYKKNLKLYLKYLKLAKKYDLIKTDKIKYLGGKFLRGFEGASEARNEFMKLKSFEDIPIFVRKFL